MTSEGVAVTIDRLLIEGVEIPVDEVGRLAALVESELQRIVDSGWPATNGLDGVAELRPLMLSTPPDVPGLARVLAERIAEAAHAQGAWDA